MAGASGLVSPCLYCIALVASISETKGRAAALSAQVLLADLGGAAGTMIMIDAFCDVATCHQIRGCLTVNFLVWE